LEEDHFGFDGIFNSATGLYDKLVPENAITIDQATLGQLFWIRVNLNSK